MIIGKDNLLKETLGSFPELFKDYFNDMLGSENEGFIPDSLLKKIRRVIITGNGDSYAVSLAAESLGRRVFPDHYALRSLDVSRHFVFPEDDAENTLVIVISVSGNGARAAEAVKSSVLKLNIPGTKINIIRAFAGAITESDVLLANASKAIIYGFNVRPDANVRNKAIEEKVEIRLHRIIYALIEELEATLKGMRKKKEVEQYLGQAEVRQTFKASKIGTIAGCYVVDGEITSTSLIRILRDGSEIYNGKLAGLRRFKDDVKEVKQGFECGISILNFNDIHEGDIIEAYKMIEEELD